MTREIRARTSGSPSSTFWMMSWMISSGVIRSGPLRGTQSKLSSVSHISPLEISLDYVSYLNSIYNILLWNLFIKCLITF
jgi:hypothetical protein